uniref:Uncharacterized protein n=1 Tax=Plectus sambesii TaxID=2011161 RepID=A0A914VZI2_9BILA
MSSRRPASPASPAPSCGSCQFQRIVAQFFRDHSRLVAKWPLPFVTFPLVLTAVLAFAFVIRIDSLEDVEGDKLSMFLPDNVESMRDLRTLLALFPPQNALRDAYSIFGASYAYVIIEDVSVQQNVLRNEILAVARDIYQRINDLTVLDRHELFHQNWTNSF